MRSPLTAAAKPQKALLLSSTSISAAAEGCPCRPGSRKTATACQNFRGLHDRCAGSQRQGNDIFPLNGIASACYWQCYSALHVAYAPSAGLRPKTLEWPLGGQQLLLRWNGCSDHHYVLGNEPLPKQHEQERSTAIGFWSNSKALNNHLKAFVGLFGGATGGAVTSVLSWLPSAQKTSCPGAVKPRS
jgi:hypothetical protein